MVRSRCSRYLPAALVSQLRVGLGASINVGNFLRKIFTQRNANGEPPFPRLPSPMPFPCSSDELFVSPLS